MFPAVKEQAEANNAFAQYIIGIGSDGTGVAADAATAQDWNQRAAYQGLAAADSYRRHTCAAMEFARRNQSRKVFLLAPSKVIQRRRIHR
jgi:TPR repeat protein